MFLSRLLEFAPLYYDLKSFGDGITKQALVRIIKKKEGKSIGRAGQGNGSGDDGRPKKRSKNSEDKAAEKITKKSTRS